MSKNDKLVDKLGKIIRSKDLADKNFKPEVEESEIAKLQKAKEDSYEAINELSLGSHKIKKESVDAFSKAGIHEQTKHFKKLANINNWMSRLYLILFIGMIIYSIGCFTHYFIELKFNWEPKHLAISIPYFLLVAYLARKEKIHKGKYFKYKDLETSIKSLPAYLEKINANTDDLKLEMAKFYFQKVHDEDKSPKNNLNIKDLTDLVKAIKSIWK